MNGKQAAGVVRRAMDALGWSRSRACSEACIDTSTLTRWEQGRTRSVRRAVRLALDAVEMKTSRAQARAAKLRRESR